MLTISDGVTHGTRVDSSGRALEARLTPLGFQVARGLVPDERRLIAAAVRAAAREHVLVVTTGGTGLAPRDVTPEALHELLDYEVPGFGEVMRAEGRRSTPFAALSRSVAGVLGRTLVIALPGSERGAVESLDAITPLLDHALSTLRGEGQHHPPEPGEAGHAPAGDGERASAPVVTEPASAPDVTEPASALSGPAAPPPAEEERR